MANNQLQVFELPDWIDEYGLDPLLSPELNSAITILDAQSYKVDQSDAGRPELISFRVYGSVDYYKEVMVYNGITDIREIYTKSAFLLLY